MGVIKRKAIIFSPGEYKYEQGTEKKVIDDLREMAKLPLRYPITYGHPPEGIPDRGDVIGTWSVKWREDLNKAEAELWFLEDEAKKIVDPEIWQKIVNYEPVGSSPGYKYRTLTEEGAQLGTLPNHLAIARPDEEPRCPLNECGVNVRFDTYKYDQILGLEFVRPDTMREDSTEEPSAEKPQEAEPAEAGTQPEPDVAPSEPASEDEETPAEQKPEEAVQDNEAPAEVQREPEVVIPASVKPVDSGEIQEVDGMYTYVPKAYRNDE